MHDVRRVLAILRLQSTDATFVAVDLVAVDGTAGCREFPEATSRDAPVRLAALRGVDARNAHD